MKCPYCSAKNSSSVVDSRTSPVDGAIRRRRECAKCARRFTTYERAKEVRFSVIKRSGKREDFDRGKVLAGVMKACEKRPVPLSKIGRLPQDVEKFFFRDGRKEIPAREIGELVLKRLYELDEVAYIRFASVYRQFRNIDEFMSEIKKFSRERRKKRVK